MADQSHRHVSWTSSLRRLAEDLDSVPAAIRYAETFLGTLPVRMERVRDAHRQGDTLAAVDAVLSLKVRAHMVGGLALERDCRALEKCLRDGGAQAAEDALHRVAASSTALAKELSEFLQGQDGRHSWAEGSACA